MIWRWCVCFFDFQFAVVEVVVSSIQDGFPRAVKKYLVCHELLVLAVCVSSFLLGIPLVTQVWESCWFFFLRRRTEIIIVTSISARTFAGRHIPVPNHRLLHVHVVGDLHRLLRSDRRVLDVRGEQTGGGHPENQRNGTAVVFQIQLVHHDSTLADGEHASSVNTPSPIRHCITRGVSFFGFSWPAVTILYRRTQINLHMTTR